MRVRFVGGAVLAALLCGAGSAKAIPIIINGGFETGDLTGWSASPSSLASVVTSAAPLGGGPGDPPLWLPTQGSYFAVISSGAGTGVYTILSQSFSANAGNVLTFDVYFDAGDYLPYNDNGFVNLIDASSSATTLYAQSVSTVGNFGANGWTQVSYTFATGGTYQIQAGVENVGDNGVTSQLGIDNVGGLAPVPEPASVVLLSLGMAAIGAVRRRRRQRSA